MNEVRTTGSWLIIWLSALALGALLWLSVVKQFDTGVQGAISALLNPATNVSKAVENRPDNTVPTNSNHSPVFSLDILGTQTVVRARLPKGETNESLWKALDTRTDTEKLRVEIEEYEPLNGSNAEWVDRLPELIGKLPLQTEDSDLHLFLSDEKSSVLGKIDNTDEKDQLTRVLGELAPNLTVSTESLKVTGEELPALFIEKNGGVLELKGQLPREYQSTDFAGKLKQLTNSNELIDSLRYSSEISNTASELENIGAVSALLAENGSRSVIEVKDKQYNMQLFGYSGGNPDVLRSQITDLLANVPFEFAIGRIGSKELEILPQSPIEKQSQELMRKILAVNFGFNSYRLAPESEPALSALLERMWANPELNLIIEGHTDSTGSPVSNQLLSQQRADAVKNYLIESGIDSTRLKALGFGDEKPISSNKTSEGRFKNRRIEVREEQNS